MAQLMPAIPPPTTSIESVMDLPHIGHLEKIRVLESNMFGHVACCTLRVMG
jgi:hypothetical protein